MTFKKALKKMKNGKICTIDKITLYKLQSGVLQVKQSSEIEYTDCDSSYNHLNGQQWRVVKHNNKIGFSFK